MPVARCAQTIDKAEQETAVVVSVVLTLCCLSCFLLRFFVVADAAAADQNRAGPQPGLAASNARAGTAEVAL